MNGAGGKFIAFRFCREFCAWRTHFFCPGIELAALRTASRIRGYVPHRQIFPCSACTISALLGAAFRCRNATLLMIIP